MTAEQVSDRLSALRSIPLFRELGDESLSRVLDQATEFEVRRGHVLVQPHQAGEGLFVIEEGVVVVELPAEKVELGPGEFFGELALLDADAVHTGRVLAASDLRCLAIRRDDFEQLLDSEPKMAIAMLKVLARRLASTAGR